MTKGSAQTFHKQEASPFAAMIEEHYDAVYRYCYSLTQHRSTAQDITQEVFLRFVGNRRYTDQGKPLAYLFTIARNLCHDWRRQKPAYPLEEMQEELLATDTDADEDVILLWQLVHTLPSPQREVILLRYGQDLKLDEIARITHTTRFAVQYRLKTALAALRRKLSEQEEHE